ncbi:hypothetical protein RCL1_008975 [Eukaryota sp. TZLM3-RCL]
MTNNVSSSVSASDYKELDRLGSGAQGITTLVQDPQGSLFCMKTLLDAKLESAPEAEMMLKELDCPYLVSFYHCIPTRRDLLLIMEYCPGGSLHDFVVVKKNKLSATDIWVVTTQLLLGLAYLHSKAIVHRDLKPGNVLLCSHERPLKVKICDFGISKDLNQNSAKSMIGTVFFMAPEVLKGQRYDTSIDLWSLGILIYFLVHGEYPFISFDEISNSEIPISNSEFGPIISKLLIRDPASRASSADLLLDPKIVEIYEDFIKETNIEDVVNLRKELRNLKKIVEDQSNLIGVVNSELLKGNEKNLELEEKISSQNSEIQEQSKLIKNLESELVNQRSCFNSEIKTLKSTLESQVSSLTLKNSNLESKNSNLLATISTQNSEITDLKSTVSSLQSNLNQASLLSSDQSNLIDQFKQFLPLLSQLQAAEERRIEDQRKAELERQRIAEEQRKAELEKQRIAEENRKAELERQRIAEEQRKAEEQRIAQENRKAELEQQRIDLEVQKMEQSRGRRLSDSERLLVYECVKIKGRRVKRGPDWRYGIQDGGAGNVGVVTGLRGPGWVIVKWSNGNSQGYRWGCQGKYDLELVD